MQSCRENIEKYPSKRGMFLKKNTQKEEARNLNIWGQIFLERA